MIPDWWVTFKGRTHGVKFFRRITTSARTVWSMTKFGIITRGEGCIAGISRLGVCESSISATWPIPVPDDAYPAMPVPDPCRRFYTKINCYPTRRAGIPVARTLSLSVGLPLLDIGLCGLPRPGPLHYISSEWIYFMLWRTYAACIIIIKDL